ncbi:MAG: radical SAM protein [Bacteroidales bacterium]|nr:radical SAM protein [Bacteroidales bacterium]
MEFSKHNIISRLKDSEDYFIVNLLSRNADILTEDQYQEFLAHNINITEELKEKGYIIDPETENNIYRQKYLEFIDNRETDEIQLFFVPGYACNFKCSYCYQDEYLNKYEQIDDQIITSFFNYIDSEFVNRKKYITIFGGEPLLNIKAQSNFYKRFIRECNMRNLDIAVVTNGYNLLSFIPVLKSASIREVQVTLDGTEDTHNTRRPHKNGSSTFLRIVDGIDALLRERIPVNLRMVIDKGNIEELSKLARFANHKGWTNNQLFKTQLGRNYELHHCQVESNRLYTRLGMYEDIYEQLKLYPEIKEFYKPAFSVAKFLFEEGELPDPLFDSCPGTKTEWAFDYTGKIYSCTATVGKEGEELGTFYPEVTKKEEIIEEWQNRDVLAIPECKDCSVQLACGGGCGSVSKNHTGRICSPDCRPVKELLELGLSYYFRETPKDFFIKN